MRSRKGPVSLLPACALFLCLLAWGLRVAVVMRHRLHPDEALYGYWGLLILNGRDPWLATVLAFKPPLLPYLTAGSLALLGPVELAVRLPGLVAGLATVCLTGRLAWWLYQHSLSALVALAVAAASPFALLFSATGFTDPVMVALGLAGCVAAAERQPVWAGVLAGLSVATKQTGVVWVPLIGGLVVVSQIQGPKPGGVMPGLARAGVGFLAVVGLVWGWDQVRVTQGAQPFWSTGVVGYGGLRLIWPAEWVPRAQAWAGWLRYLLGLPALGVLVVGAGALIVRGARRWGWTALYDWVLVGFCLSYLLIHWLWAFPIWDRYLLPLVPAAAVLVGRVVSVLVDIPAVSARRWLKWAVVAGVVVGMAIPAGRAVAGEIPVGAGQASYDGIDQVAEYLRGLPEGSVLYHHWLGWQYAFYLFDGPLYPAYWSTPAWLARDVQAFGEAEARYIVFPSWESSARVEAALAEVGYRLALTLEVQEGGEVRFRVYKVVKSEARGPMCEHVGCWLSA